MSSHNRIKIIVLPLAALACTISGCTAWNGNREAPQPVAPSGSEISQVSYEEPVQRGQSPDEAREDASWIDPLNVGEKTLALTGNLNDQAKAKRLYSQAESTYEQAMELEGNERAKGLKKAVGLFKRAASYHENSDIEENSLMYAGECHFFLDEYPDATKMYDSLIKKYPNTRHLDVIGNRRFKLARYWLERFGKERDWSLTPNLTDEQLPLFDRFGNAVKLFDLIRLDDPTGHLADDATLAAANAHFREANFMDADRFYTDLRQNFPSSEHQFTAHYLGVVTKMKVYQGPAYDGKPMEEASKLLTRLKRQFPDKIQENIAVIEKLDRDIRAAQAERLWYMAGFYEKRSEYGGARHYYRELIKQFPTSNMAEAAKSRIQQIEERPDSPEPYASWLIDWFDRTDDLPQASAVPLNNSSETIQR